MDCEKIENLLSELKVDSLNRIRNKRRVMDNIHSEHLKDIHAKLTKIRLFVVGISIGHTPTEIIEMVDKFIYELDNS